MKQLALFDDWLRSGEGREQLALIRGELYLHQSGQPLREIDFHDLVRNPRQASFWKRELMLSLGKTCASDGGFSCMS